MVHAYFPFSMVRKTSYNQRCIPYPTFTQLLARLDQLHPDFGWQENLTQPLQWLFGNGWPLDTITIDRLDLVMPEWLCQVFDIPPACVLCFCEEVLRALEIARADAVKMHRENPQCCLECGDLLKYPIEEEF